MSHRFILRVGMTQKMKVLQYCIGFELQDCSSEVGYRYGFCEKPLEASPVSSGANANWLQNGLTTGEG